MIRDFDNYLKQWKDRPNRKPLIIRGARQVGKTYAVESFASEHYEHFVKVNFEETPEVKEFFETNDVAKIIRNLEIFYGKKIDKQNTLLFLDEIQACPSAIKTLRYFYEKLPALSVIAAGSLLDHALNKINYSMPVGRVEFAYMHPMNFYEFLNAIDEKEVVEYLKRYELKDTVPEAIHNKILELLRLYYFVGGMPEAVKVFAKTDSLTDVEIVHESIVRSLEYDFGKYGNRTEQDLLIKLLRYLPRSVGKKFKYTKAIEGERTERIKRALNLLRLSRIVHLVYSSTSSKIPLDSGVNEKLFKAIFLDIGLANRIMHVRLLNIKQLITSNEGDLAEQFIGQQLLASVPHYIDGQLYYWQRERRNSEAEIDYVIEVNNEILPIEVKAGKTGRLKSLHLYMAEKGLDVAVRFNLDVPSVVDVKQRIITTSETKSAEYKLISLPLYLVQEVGRLAFAI